MMVRGDGHDPTAAPGSGATFLSIGPGWSSLANTPFRRHKTWVHEGGISTPLIVQWPKGIAARGELRHTPGHLIDLVPTILEVAGGKKPEQWNGKPVPPAPGHSLVPLFAKDGTITHDSIWWLHEGNRALRMGDWKIVAAGKNSPWELYDLSSDRAESKNLAKDKPEKVQNWWRSGRHSSTITRCWPRKICRPIRNPTLKNEGLSLPLEDWRGNNFPTFWQGEWHNLYREAVT